MKKRNVGIVTIMVIVQVVMVFSLIYFFISSVMTKDIERNAIESMRTIVQERSRLIENYVQEAESYLTAYGRAGEITDLLLHPEDPDCVKAAQIYTELYSMDREYLEGIYASKWDTRVLVHTHPQAVGMVTREDSVRLKELQDAMLEADGVYNTGILISPASGAQIISMYRACYNEEGEPIGLTGCGIYTDGLVELLDNLPSDGMENLKYSLVNVNTGEYIFNSDPEMITQVAQEEYVQSIISGLRSGASANVNVTSYREKNEKNYVAYNYMADRGWVFLITDPSKELFSSVGRVQATLLLICFIGVVVMAVFTYLLCVNFMAKPFGEPKTGRGKEKEDDAVRQNALRRHNEKNDESKRMMQAADAMMESLQETARFLRRYCRSLKENLNTAEECAYRLSEEIGGDKSVIDEIRKQTDDGRQTLREMEKLLERFHTDA